MRVGLGDEAVGFAMGEDELLGVEDERNGHRVARDINEDAANAGIHVLVAEDAVHDVEDGVVEEQDLAWVDLHDSAVPELRESDGSTSWFLMVSPWMFS